MLDESFSKFDVWVWNASVEALVEYRVQARSAMRARIVVRDLHDPEMLSKRVLRVLVVPLAAGAPALPEHADNPHNWEPL